MSQIRVSLDEPDIERLADAVARRVEERLGRGTPWLDADAAAAYLAAPLSRVRKLTMTGDLTAEHDGRRVLYHRDELDAYIRRGGAVSP
jgi:excisionase family DNA binding protein